ncbi:hypothetical protein DXT63_16615 [Thermoanaerobacteraceae bacterium SP2]|nr:hypothetical protein DXT63_16615 [Thermoanaerobacteraceae bacterium SP2]
MSYKLKNLKEVCVMNLKETFKKYGVPFLAGTVILGSAAGFTGISKSIAAPQNPPAVQQQAQKEDQQQSPLYKGSIFLGQQDQTESKAQDLKETKDVKAEQQEDANLASKAKIKKDEAIKAAMAAYPGYAVKGAAIGNENGYLIYEIKMVDNAGKSLEVKVDAGNGKVLAADNQAEDNEKENKAEEAHSAVDNDNIQEEVEE